MMGHLISSMTAITQVVKSRIQGAAKIPGVTPKYNWTYPASVLIVSPLGQKSFLTMSAACPTPVWSPYSERRVQRHCTRDLFRKSFVSLQAEESYC